MDPVNRGTRPQLPSLTSLRGFAALLVVAYHVTMLGLFHVKGAGAGYVGVGFFFVLSGFILTHAYGHRLKDLLTLNGYGAFLRARLIRLYPLHLFMLALIGLMIVALGGIAHAGGYPSIFELPYHQDISARGLVLSLLLVQGWNTMDRLTWNGLSWFVSVEFALYLLFPLILWLAHGRAWRGAAPPS